MTDYYGAYNTLPRDGEKEVFTIDECFIAGSKELFQKVRFDEKACDNWHCYAVELSLQCHCDGLCVKVFDADIVHKSGGNLNDEFFYTFYKIAKKYRKNTNRLAHLAIG